MRRFTIYALVWTVFAADGLQGQLAEPSGQPWWVQAAPVILLAIVGYALIAVLAVRQRRRLERVQEAEAVADRASAGPEPHVP